MWEPILMLLELCNQMATGLLSWLSLDLYFILIGTLEEVDFGKPKDLKKW